MINPLPGSTNQKIVMLIVFLAICGFFLYYGTLDFDFFRDDHRLIVDNYKVKELKYVLESFSSRFFSFPDFPFLHYWRPVILVSFYLDFVTWGIHPAGYHLTNIVLGALNGILVFFIFYLFSRRMGPAFFIALFFTLHPAHIETVSWISGRTDLLSAFFILSSAATFILFLKNRDRRIYGLSLLCFIPALLAKENAVFLPFILAAAARFYKDRTLPRPLLYLLPHIPLTLLYIFLHSHFAGSQKVLQFFSFADIPLVLKTFGAYMKFLFLPFYQGPYFPLSYFFAHSWEFFLFAGAAAALIFLIFYKRDAFPFSSFAVFSIAFLIPLLNPKMVPSYPPIAYRFAYLPVLLPAAFMVDCFAVLTNERLKRLALVSVSVVLLVCAVQVTIFQHFFKNEAQYGQKMAAYYPRDHASDPVVLLSSALSAAQKGHYTEALTTVERCIHSGGQTNWFAWGEQAKLLKANILIATARFEEGKTLVDEILKTTEHENSIYYGNLLLARIHDKKGNFQAALEIMLEIEKRGTTADLYTRMALVSLKLLKPAQALAYLEKARDLNPDLPNYYALKEAIFRVRENLDEGRLLPGMGRRDSQNGTN